MVCRLNPFIPLFIFFYKSFVFGHETQNIDTLSQGIDTSGKGLYNIPRSRAISKTLIDFPLACVEIISDYDYGTHDGIYDRIVSQLNSLIENRNNEVNLNFYNTNFLQAIYLALPRPKTEMAKNLFTDSFCDGLSRLIFNWMVHQEQSFKDGKFIKILKDEIEPAYEILKRDYTNIFIPLLSDFQSNLNDKFFIWDFINYEILERHEEIFNLYHNVLEEFYHLNTDFKTIISKYFGTRVDDDLILKAMIYKYDIQGEIKNHFLENSNSTIQSRMSFKEMRNENPIESIESIESHIAKIFNQQNEFITKKIIKFYENQGIRSEIKYSYQFEYLLTNSKNEFDPLTMESMSRIIGFPNEWNIQKFKDYVNELEAKFPRFYKDFSLKLFNIKKENDN